MRRHHRFRVTGMHFREALTFDDVLLEPAKSAILPNQTNTQTRLTRSIELGIPPTSSAGADE